MIHKSLLPLVLASLATALLVFGWYEQRAIATHDGTGSHIDQISIDVGPRGVNVGVDNNGKPAVGDRDGDGMSDAEGTLAGCGGDGAGDGVDDDGDAVVDDGCPSSGTATSGTPETGLCGNGVDDDPYRWYSPPYIRYDGVADDGCVVTLSGLETCIEIIDDGILNADEDLDADLASIDVTIGTQPGPGGGVPATRPLTAWQYSLNSNVDILDVLFINRNFLILASGGGSPFTSTTSPNSDLSSPFVASVADGGGVSQAETGPGVLSRVAIEGHAPGLATLNLSQVAIKDINNESIPIDVNYDAKVAISKDVNQDGDLLDAGELFTCLNVEDTLQTADVQVVAVNTLVPATIPLGTPFAVSASAVVHNNGPVSPLITDLIVQLNLPPDCTPAGSLIVIEDLLLDASIFALVGPQAFDVICAAPGLHVFVVSATAVINDPAITDINPTNNFQIKSTTRSNFSQSAAAADNEGDGVPDESDNCPSTPNTNQANFDGDTMGDACDPDGDNDFLPNTLETSCGSNALDAAARPERVDGLFSAVDDDADTLVDEALPAGSENVDCDGDGWTGNQEMAIFSSANTTKDQDPCGNDGWPADLDPNNILNIGDFNSFIFPLGTEDGHGTFNYFGHTVPDPGRSNEQRWNLDPGNAIDIGDLNSLNPAVFAGTAKPPMFGGQPAFFTNGGQCPYPP